MAYPNDIVGSSPPPPPMLAWRPESNGLPDIARAANTMSKTAAAPRETALIFSRVLPVLLVFPVLPLCPD